MTTIDTTRIATNRYAPAGGEAINLYSTHGVGSLTLGQLVVSVCIGAAAAYEGQSVLKMNTMTADSVTLEAASAHLKRVADGTANWAEAKAFATDTLGVDASALPSTLNSYDNRMKAVQAMKAKMDALTQQQQQDMIDLQTLVNRRDVAFSTSSNILRALGNSANANAVNF